MSWTFNDEREEGLVSRDTPFLSHSRISKYLHCPEQYRLYYVENLRPRIPSANLAFGQVIHEALAGLLKNGEDPVKAFQRIWQEIREIDLDYGKKDSWEKLSATGEALLEKFLEEELPRLGNVRAVEQRFELSISDLELPFIGVIDLLASLDGNQTVVDFKTSGSSYQGHEAMLSDQLTAYQLAAPQAEQAALCVLAKTKEPKIDWQVIPVSSHRTEQFLRKARHISRQIRLGRFYMRPGLWCGWCDYLPVCVENKQKTEATLVQIR